MDELLVEQMIEACGPMSEAAIRSAVEGTTTRMLVRMVMTGRLSWHLVNGEVHFDLTTTNVHALAPRVLAISLWQPYAGLVCAGVKTLETRDWPWPYGPTWLVIHAAKHVDRKALLRLATVAAPIAATGASGCFLGLAWVEGSRPFAKEDETAACYPHEPGRFVWPLRFGQTFTKPIKVARGPQKFVYLPRDQVLAAL